jgi:hypothetical protein
LIIILKDWEPEIEIVKNTTSLLEATKKAFVYIKAVKKM